MKKFFILLTKELRELLTPQFILPFVIIMLVFFLIGDVVSKQSASQSNAKDQLAVVNLDNSAISKSAIKQLSITLDVKEFSGRNDYDLVTAMRQNNISAGILIPADFSTKLEKNGKTSIHDYYYLNTLSYLAAKKYAPADSSVAIINNYLSDYLISQKLADIPVATLKNPLQVQNFVASKTASLAGNGTEVLTYIEKQTVYIPIILFLVIVISSQLIATTIASEKENKTLETLLSMPVSRRAIVSAKMIAAGVVSLIVAVIYMVGLQRFSSSINTTSAPSVSNVSAGAGQIAGELGLKFTTASYIELGLILFLGILVALALAMILGAFSEDVKSVQGIIAPIMILVLIPYFLTSFLDVSTLSPLVKWLIYIIPFSHIFLAAPNILLGNQLSVLYGGIYLLLIFIVSVFVAARIFSSDLILTIKLNFRRKKLL